MPRRCTYPGCYNECIQNRKKGRLRRNAVSPKVKIQRFTYQYHDSGFGVSIQTAVPGNHGEIKSRTNDGVVCIDSTFMIQACAKGGGRGGTCPPRFWQIRRPPKIFRLWHMPADYHGFQPKREHAYTYMQIVYLSLTYFKRADSFETNDTRIFLNTYMKTS